MTNFQRVKEILKGIVILLCSYLMVRLPTYGFYIIALILCVTMLVRGLSSLIYYITMARHMVGGKLQLYKGIIMIDIGLFFLNVDNMPELFLVIYLLISNLISGVIDVMRAMEARRLESGSWKLNMATGLISMISGLACAFCLGRQNVLVYIYAAGLFYTGCLHIAAAFRRSAIVYIP